MCSTQYFLDAVKVEYLICTQKKSFLCRNHVCFFLLILLVTDVKLLDKETVVWFDYWNWEAFETWFRTCFCEGSPTHRFPGATSISRCSSGFPLSGLFHHITFIPFPCLVLFFPGPCSGPSLLSSFHTLFPILHRYVCPDHHWVVKNMHTLIIGALLRLMGVMWL